MALNLSFTLTQQENETLDDLATEAKLMDDDQTILCLSPSTSSSPPSYKTGECILHLPQHRALQHLDKDESDITTQLADLSTTAQECEKGSKKLKVVFYALGLLLNLLRKP